MIEVKGISKRYGRVIALDNVSLVFAEHKIYGLLGRNGAGKTTLLSAIAGRIFADKGSISVNGFSVRDGNMESNNVYMMSEQGLYPEGMTVKKVFKKTALFYEGFDMEAALELCRKFQLATNKKTNALSTGYASILKIITALSTNAEYLLFDEPVLGLDANHRDVFYKELLKKFAEKPFTAVISTHLVEEITNLAEEIIVIKNGQIIINESCQNLLTRGYTVSGPAAAVEQYVSGKTLLGIDSLGGLKTACLSGMPEEVPETLEVGRLDLQQLFIYLTND